MYRTGPGSFSTPLKQGSTDPNDQFHIGHWFDGFTQNHRFEFLADSTTSTELAVKYNSRHAVDDLKAKIARLGYGPAGGFSQTSPPRHVWGPDGPPQFVGVPSSAIDPTTGFPFQKLLAAQALSSLPPRPLPTAAEVNVGVTIESHWPGKGAATPCLVARTDSNKLQRLDPETLEPLEAFTWEKYDKRLSGQMAASHSQVDSETEEEFNFDLSLGLTTPTYKVFKIKGGFAEPKVTILAEIQDAPPCYLHSFFLTKKYVVLSIWQATLKLGGLEVGLNGNIADGIESKWNPHLPVLFYVIDREGTKGVVRTFKGPAQYCFHSINAYDDGDDAVLTYCKLNDNSPIWRYQLKYMRSLPQSFEDCAPYFARVRLSNISSSSESPSDDVLEELIGSKNHNLELPQTNPAHQFSSYRYAYGIHSQDLTSLPFHGLIRYDCHKDTPEDQRALVWAPEKVIAGEPVFVRDPSLPLRPDPNTELRGVLLSLIYDAKMEASALVAIDPASMTEIARASMPRGTISAMGFHGSFTTNEFIKINKAQSSSAASRSGPCL